jgi:hypothetical protein
VLVANHIWWALKQMKALAAKKESPFRLDVSWLSKAKPDLIISQVVVTSSRTIFWAWLQICSPLLSGINLYCHAVFVRSRSSWWVHDNVPVVFSARNLYFGLVLTSGCMWQLWYSRLYSHDYASKGRSCWQELHQIGQTWSSNGDRLHFLVTW